MSLGQFFMKLGLSGFAAAATYRSITIIPEGFAGLIEDTGSKSQIIQFLSPGYHFILPWLQRCILFDLRPRSIETRTIVKSCYGSTGELHILPVKSIFQPDPTLSSLSYIHDNFGATTFPTLLVASVHQEMSIMIADRSDDDLYLQEEISKYVKEKCGLFKVNILSTRVGKLIPCDRVLMTEAEKEVAGSLHSIAPKIIIEDATAFSM